jgi:hypothetical protein
VTNNTPHSGLFSLDLPVLQADTLQKLAARLARLERGVKGNPRGSVTDPGCISWIQDPNFFQPGSRVEKTPDLDLHQIIQPIKVFLSFRKYDPGCSSRIRILIFYPDPGYRGQKGTESRIRIRNTVFLITSDESDIGRFNSATDPASVLC